METRIIKAVFGASKSIVAPKRFKNDWGQVLELVGITLPQTFTAHFANSRTGTAKKRIGQSNQVDVPDEFFTSGADIYCWVMVHDTASDGRTMYTVRIPIEDRGTATDEEPTPVQQDVIEQAIAALNAAVEKTAQDVESADASAQSAKADADRAETARDTTEEYVSTVQGYAQQAQTSATNASSSAMASANSASQAQQIKTDVEGMVDEAQSAAGASAQSALESEQSASQASAFATSASQSAETASTKASEASASAQTAGAKATEASGYASTASAKASESSQSASAASGYATQAGQAKTAAETAQGLTEQAQADAESAKDDAESARDTARQIVSGISGKVEQIDQNTANIASLEVDRYKAYVTDTASGAVASFSDGADDVPMVDVLVNIDPVQDLSHGDPSPDNICPISGWTGANVQRTGVNLFDKSNVTHGRFINGNNVSVANAEFAHSDYIPVKSGQVYYCSPPWYTGVNVIFFYDNNKVNIGKVANNTHLYTMPNNCCYVRINMHEDEIDTVFLNYPSTNTLFTPYQGNLYPITFPVEAGTVYGGTLDVTTGVLTVDRANIASYNGESLPSTWISDRDVYAQGATPTTGAQVVYKLAEPITYQLTPTELNSLLGTNNIWADTGDSTAEYRADTKLYTNKKIAEAVNALA